MTHQRENTTFTELTDQDLQRLAPATFATKAAPNTSRIYNFVPTSQIVEEMRRQDWAPVKVTEQRVKVDSERYGFQKHMIRFQRKSDLATARKVNDLIPEVVLTNSHDGKAAFVLHAGLFRLACLNGLIIADCTFNSIHVPHFKTHQIVDASFEVLESVPKILKEVDSFKAKELNPIEKQAFASGALVYKYGSLEESPITQEFALTVRRPEDEGNSLWNVYNRLQENLIKGGLVGRYRRASAGLEEKHFSRTREVKSIDENIRLNKALWTMAETIRNGEKINFSNN